MLLQLIISIILGILAGTFTGLIPGIHINLIGTILVGFSTTVFSGINPLLIIIFISAMAITHTFVDFIPSVFLGCPDSDTQLSVLPGHELLKDGRGYEAIMLTIYGGIIAVFVLLIISFPLSSILQNVYEMIQPKMFFILCAAVFILIITEKRKIPSLIVFIISGVLGLFVLNSGIEEPLLPLLSGLFGSSLLIISIKNKTKIPRQRINSPKCKFLKPILGSVIASPLCSFLPGLGSGQAAVLGNLIAKTDRENFLVLLGATNTLVMGFSFVSLYAISKTRTGAASAIQEIIGTFSWQTLVLILVTILISGTVSFFLTKFLAKFLANRINKINYTYISIGTLIILTLVVLYFSGILGLLVLTTSTFIGIYCNSLEVRKTHMMGCLLIPTIIYYGIMLI